MDKRITDPEAERLAERACERDDPSPWPFHDDPAYLAWCEESEREQERLQREPRVKGRPASSFDAECDRCGKVKPVLYATDACTIGYPGHPGAEWTTFETCADCLTGRSR
jgi:hypothetical protein